MCGIVCAFDIKGDQEVVRASVLKMAQRVRPSINEVAKCWF